jgi:hypothetical protein
VHAYIKNRTAELNQRCSSLYPLSIL